MPKSWQSLRTGLPPKRRLGVKPGGWDMCSTYTSKKAFQNLQLLRSHPRTRYLWRRLPWLSCGVIFEADILTEIVMHLTCLLFKVLLLSMFFCTCATLFFFESISLDKNKKESFRLMHRERKSGRVPRKVLVQRRRLPERKHPKKAASWHLPNTWQAGEKEKKVPKKKSEKTPKARALMNSRKANKGRDKFLANFSTWGGCWSTVDAKDKMSDWFSAANTRLLSQNELC